MVHVAVSRVALMGEGGPEPSFGLAKTALTVLSLGVWGRGRGGVVGEGEGDGEGEVVVLGRYWLWKVIG